MSSADCLPRRPGGLTIPRRLVVLALAVAVPLLAVSMVILDRLAEHERARERQIVHYSAKIIRGAVDAQLGRTLAAAQALGLSPALQQGDLASFRTEAIRQLTSLPGTWAVLSDAGGRQMVNTFPTARAPLPRLSPTWADDARRAFETGQPQISGLAVGAVARAPAVFVGVPVFHGATPAYYLMVGCKAELFRDLLDSQGIPTGWLAAIADRDGKFIARSQDHEARVGQPISEGWRSIMHRDGEAEFPSLEGEMLYAANALSPLTGWAVGLAARKSAVEEPVRRLLFWAMLVNGLVALLCIPLAIGAARRITRPIGALERQARALGRHQASPSVGTGVPEFDEISGTMAEAAEALAGQEKELRSAAAEAARSEARARESEAQLSLFIENAPAAIAMFDRNMCYLAASRRFIDDYGLAAASTRELMGRSHYQVFPDIPQRWKDIHDSVLAGQMRHHDSDPFPRGDGHVDWVRWRMEPWYDAVGTIGGALLFSEVITDLKNADAALTEALREKAEMQQIALTAQAELFHASRLSMLGATASTIAHEVNQPVGAAINYLHAAQALVQDSAVAAILRKTGTQLENVSGIVRRVRDFAARREIRRQPTEIKPLIAEASALGLLGVAGQDVRLSFDLPATLPRILIDPVQIQQVLVNLIRNAAEAVAASDKKEIAITVARGDEKWIEICISDSGPGFAPEIRDRLFSPFLTTKEEGTGLGLSTSRSILQAHGGRLWAEHGGPGATLRLTLPVESMADA